MHSRARFITVLDPRAREGEGGGEGGEGGEGGGLLTGKVDGDAGGGAGEGGQGGEGGGFEIPEKFLVNGEDGQPDYKAIIEKALPAYLNLEKRIGAGEAPPEAPDKYKLEKYLPEGFEANPEKEQVILTRMHGLKLNNAQVQGVLSLYGELLGQGVAQEKADMATAMTALKKEWGAEYDANMSRANVALSTLATPDELKAITSDPRLINNAALIKILAKAGAEFEDDRAANQMGAGEIESVDQLRRSPAYLDEKHPDHKRVREKVAAAYQRGYKDRH